VVGRRAAQRAAAGASEDDVTPLAAPYVLIGVDRQQNRGESTVLEQDGRYGVVSCQEARRVHLAFLKLAYAILCWRRLESF